MCRHARPPIVGCRSLTLRGSQNRALEPNCARTENRLDLATSLLVEIRPQLLARQLAPLSRDVEEDRVRVVPRVACERCVQAAQALDVGLAVSGFSEDQH